MAACRRSMRHEPTSSMLALAENRFGVAMCQRTDRFAADSPQLDFLGPTVAMRALIGMFELSRPAF